MDNLVAGLASAAIGGGLARTRTKRRPDESEDQYKRRLALNTTTGVVGGGAVGAALPSAFAALSGLYPQSYFEQLKNNPAKALKAAPGKALDATTGFVSDIVGPLGIAGGGIGATAGYYSTGKQIDQKQKAFAEKVKQHQDALSSNRTALAKNTNSAAQSSLEKLVKDENTRLRWAERGAKNFDAGTGKLRMKGMGRAGLGGTIGGALIGNYVNGLFE
jgi:hypothetical protein